MELSRPKRRFGALGVFWNGGMIALIGVAAVVDNVQAFVELTPHHPETLWIGMACAIALSALAIVISLWQSQRSPTGRIADAVVAAALGGFAGFLLGHITAERITMAMDFPAGHITRAPAALVIDAIYTKGAQHHIDTRGVTLDISPADFAFIQAHRRPDNQNVGDRIISDGWFCADVALETAGKAVRVLRRLPGDSIGLCADMKPLLLPGSRIIVDTVVSTGEAK